MLALVARAQAGDPDAFETLFHQFAEALFRYVYLRCHDAGLAEDVMGELWVRVVQHLPAFRAPPHAPPYVFRVWLYRIAQRLLIDLHRRRTHDNIPLHDAVAAAEAALDAGLLRREDHAELFSALQMLTGSQRDVLLLRFVEERSLADVAAITGRNTNAVKALQRRGLATLARLLHPERGNPGALQIPEQVAVK